MHNPSRDDILNAIWAVLAAPEMDEDLVSDLDAPVLAQLFDDLHDDLQRVLLTDEEFSPELWDWNEEPAAAVL